MRRTLLSRRHAYFAVGALLLLALSGCDLGAAPTDQGDFRGKVLFGSGDGQFADSHLLIDGTVRLGFVADVDGNGRADVVTSTADNAVRIYLNRWTERPA